MKYILVENKQSVLLGPVFWRHRFIQSELDDLEIEFTVPPTEPNSYLNINDNLEIYPVDDPAIPAHDPKYETLAGPFWTFSNNTASGVYTAVQKSIQNIKSEMKQLAADERYKKEVAGAKVTVQGVQITADTSRDGRHLFLQKYSLMGDADTVDWKFPETWVTITKAELGAVIMAGANHIQAQYDWEKTVSDQIDAASTVAELKTIVITGA